ncbi:protein-tyrosine phosphatase family protein [Cesiribacter andamanensis]|uniref:Protein tyrosine/serine phosphatase n=1 Tax=Cesiribacter andamanensis AMV16 TaxID=1279009 RepID=M7N992_9BACT|nr:protein-tyrosine-phosphatase [Cesiribacter andamanensis]EMR03817.1 Protein tyrosine/serine phosphatase [Cesiribacter andamanensis AMV16]
MKVQIEKMLSLIRKGQVAEGEIEALISRLKAALAENTAQGKELGPYIRLIKQAQKAQARPTGLSWLPLLKGSLAIGHKPGGKLSFAGLQAEGVTAVLTLLQEKEGALLIGQQVQKAGMGWIWFPFSASRPHTGEAAQEVITLYEEMEALLAGGGRLYIHCSAGIHRTGMITYGLLRYLGQGEADARESLLRLRSVTAEQAGEERLTWGDQFARG